LMRRRVAVVPVSGRTRAGEGARGRSRRCKGEQRGRSVLIMIVIVRMMRTSRMRAVTRPRRKGRMRWRKGRMRWMMRVRRVILTVVWIRMN
jgi:hypothetical protein